VEYRVKYDPLADALYIKVKEGEVSDSLELREGLIVDLDDKGEVIGIEILNFSKTKIDMKEIIIKGIEILVKD
jgi:uncharacterized protein YuzE